LKDSAKNEFSLRKNENLF